MRRCTFIIFLLIYSTACSTQHRIKFIHWNDVHAENEPFVVREGARTVRVGGFAYDKSVIDSLRSSAIKAGETPFLLDAGDEFQGTIISTLTKGRSQYELLNLLHPDAVTLGNHEFDYGWVNLQRLLSDIVRFPIVNANVFDAHGSHIASPYVIVEKDSIRIAVIGLVTSALRHNTLPENIKGLTIKEYDEILPDILKDIRKEAPSFTILLTHVGVEDDSMLAAHYPEISVIVGGHSHTALFHPVVVGNTIIVQAGSKGRYIGDLDLDFDDKTHAVSEIQDHLIEVDDSLRTPDRTADSIVQSLVRDVNIAYSKTIATLKNDWKADHEFNNAIGTYEADAFRRMLHTDLGCLNLGGIRRSEFAGHITMKDVLEINPFNNEIMIVSMKGAILRRAVEFMVAGSGTERCDLAGLIVKSNRGRTSITINGKPLSDNPSYTMATNAFVASHLKGMFGLSEGEFNVQGTGISDGDALIEQITKDNILSGVPIPWLIK